jgi:uncharacterized protein (DUF2147 family)
MKFETKIVKAALASAALLWSASAQAASDPTGIWFDHNGRGAVEIKQCASGKGLCGHVVYVIDPKNASRCGLQILGEVTTDGGGWIYSPERKSKYDVALKRLSDDKLRVVGNANSRFFSRTFTWNRAPDNIIRCGETTAAAPAKSGGTAAPAKVATTEPATAAPAGAATGSAALAASTPAKAAEPAAPAPEAQTSPAPGATAEKPASEPAKTAAAQTEPSPSEKSDTGSKKKCKYRIPYIGRTVSAPCR